MFDVLIIGAGAAGIAAGRRLAGTGRDVLILEARKRIGGRADTQVAGGWPIDLGCGWLHSADRNPWAGLAAEENWTIDRTPPAWQQQWRDIGFTAAEQRDAGQAFGAFHRALSEMPPPSDRAADALPPDGRWNAYLQALSGFINGAALDRLSIADYITYDDAESGVNWRLPKGYGAFVAAMAAGLPIRTGFAAETIDHSGPIVRVSTGAGTVEARCVIVAVPPTMLAKERLRFSPGLPDKAEAAAALPLGLANKAFLALDRPEPFEPDTQLLGDPHDPNTGAYYLRPFGRSLIEAFFGGPGACALEKEGEGTALAFAIEQLVALLGSEMRSRVTPLAETRWGSEPFIAGAYSHALPGQAAARAALAQPVDDRLFFAGEACSKRDFSTAHGAFETGVIAAEAALASLARG